MDARTYQKKSIRTLNTDLTQEQLLSNMIMGIAGESGEIADVVKKHLYQGHELDFKHIAEEIGDVMFYIVNLCNVLQLDLETILGQNYNKLLARYPEGFEAEKSINRRV
jgi:NTP pyrophosphatase (non-canonical NTP hydrolase)